MTATFPSALRQAIRRSPNIGTRTGPCPAGGISSSRQPGTQKRRSTCPIGCPASTRHSNSLSDFVSIYLSLHRTVQLCAIPLQDFLLVLSGQPADRFDRRTKVIEVASRLMTENRPGTRPLGAEQTIVDTQYAQLKLQGLGRIVTGVEVEPANLFVKLFLTAAHRPRTKPTHLIGYCPAAVGNDQLQRGEVLKHRAIQKRDDGDALLVDEFEGVGFARIAGTARVNQRGDIEFDQFLVERVP